MKKTLLVLAIALIPGVALATKYLKKPVDGGTDGALIKMGATSDDVTETVTQITVDDNGNLITSSSEIGAANGSTVTATFYGDLSHPKIVLDLDSFVIGTFDNGTNINGSTLNGAMGAALFDFADNGVFLVKTTGLDIESIQCSTSNGTALADTPDLGVGTGQATSLTASLLSSVTNGENIHTGQTLTDINGSGLVSNIAATDFFIDTDAEGTLYLNVSDKYGIDLNGETLIIENGRIILDIFYVNDIDDID